MASPKIRAFEPNVVHCDGCGKEIRPKGEVPIPTDYVWRDGRVLCWDCLKDRSKVQK